LEACGGKMEAKMRGVGCRQLFSAKVSLIIFFFYLRKRIKKGYKIAPIASIYSNPRGKGWATNHTHNKYIV